MSEREQEADRGYAVFWMRTSENSGQAKFAEFTF